jgi:hypothetical protein
VSLALRAGFDRIVESDDAIKMATWILDCLCRELAISYLDRGDFPRPVTRSVARRGRQGWEAESTLGDPGDEHRLEAAHNILEIAPEMKGRTAAIMRMWLSTDRARLPVRPHGLAQSNTARCSGFR